MWKSLLFRSSIISMLLIGNARAASAIVDMDPPDIEPILSDHAESTQADHLVKIVRQSFYSNRYTAAWGEPDGIWTPRMRALFRKDRKIAQKQGVGNLNFDFPSSSQDPHISQLNISVFSSSYNKIVVRANFRNWKDEMDVRYTFLMQGGKYLLDEVQSFGKDNKWMLSDELSDN